MTTNSLVFPLPRKETKKNCPLPFQKEKKKGASIVLFHWLLEFIFPNCLPKLPTIIPHSMTVNAYLCMLLTLVGSNVGFKILV